MYHSTDRPKKSDVKPGITSSREGGPDLTARDRMEVGTTGPSESRDTTKEGFASSFYGFLKRCIKSDCFEDSSNDSTLLSEVARGKRPEQRGVDTSSRSPIGQEEIDTLGVIDISPENNHPKEGKQESRPLPPRSDQSGGSLASDSLARQQRRRDQAGQFQTQPEQPDGSQTIPESGNGAEENKRRMRGRTVLAAYANILDIEGGYSPIDTSPQVSKDEIPKIPNPKRERDTLMEAIQRLEEVKREVAEEDIP